MSEEPDFPQNYPPVQNDPFPKMVIWCLAITFVGLFVIFGVLLFEFIQRGQSKHVGAGTPLPGVTAPAEPAAAPPATQP